MNRPRVYGMLPRPNLYLPIFWASSQSPISPPITPPPPPPCSAPPPPLSISKAVKRYADCNADVTISRKGVSRNDQANVRVVCHDGSKLHYQLCCFDAPKYDFVHELLYNMSASQRSTWLMKKYFEIVIDESSFDSGFHDIFQQLAKLDTVLDQVRNLTIEIEIPDGGCKVESYKEYSKTTTYRYLSEFTEKLSAFTSLAKLTVVLNLPYVTVHALRKQPKHCTTGYENLTGYILPFKEMVGPAMCRFQIGEREVNHGTFPPRWVSEGCLKHFKREYEKFAEEKRNEVVTRYSASSPDLDMKPLLKWAN